MDDSEVVHHRITSPRNNRRTQGISALSQRLPGQRTPPDPSVEQPNAADLTYGWHTASHDEDSSDSDEFVNFSEDEEDAEEAVETHQMPTNALQSESQSTSRWARLWRSLDDDNSRGKASDIATQAHDGPSTEGDSSNLHESFVCRICFDGPGSTDEGGESLGRLLAPCRCRGTMKFVHQGCLSRWRATSSRQSSVMACDQCGSPYRFRSSPFVGLATNRLLLFAVSMGLFISIVWIVGFSAEYIVQYMDKSLDKDSKPLDHSHKYKNYWLHQKDGNEGSATSRLYDYINLDQAGDDGSDDAGSYYDYRYRLAYSEPAAYVTLVKAAIKYVGSGRAFQHVWFDGASNNEEVETQNTEESEMGWWQTLLDNWKYGKGGIWEGQKPEDRQTSHIESTEVSSMEPLSSVVPEEVIAKSSNGVRVRERYDARSATSLGPGEKPRRLPPGQRPSKSSYLHSQKKEKPIGPSILERLLLQLSLGASLVGMSSFLTLLLGISTWGPFHLNLGLGRGFARVARRRARGATGGNSEGEALVAVFLLFLVFVGIIRALFAVYNLTKYLSKRMLLHVEDIIVDWSGDDEVDTPAHNESLRG